MSYIGRQNLGGAYRQLDDISSGFDGSDTTHTMQVNSQNVTVGDVNQILLSLGGVIQKPGTDFTVSGSVLTFTTAPAANTSFFAILLGSDNGGTVTPTDASVTTAKFASDATLTTTGTVTTQGTGTTGGTITIENTDTGGAANDYFGKLIFKGNDSSSSASGTRASVEGKVTGNFGSSQIDFLTASGGATAARIATLSPDGLSLADGNITFEGSGHGIHLGVTSATAANLLDDYEEGTWTPAISNVTTSAATGKYTKIGRHVSLHLYMAISGGTLDTTTIQITGVPFANGDHEAIGSIMYNQIDHGADYQIMPYFNQGTSSIRIYQSKDATGWSSLATQNFSSSTSFFMSLVYES